jgi:hypothetical protein
VDKIFAENITISNYLGILKNSDYLKWRYLENFKNKYEYFEIKDRNVIVGYIVCKNKKIKYEVSDLLLNGEKTEELNLIIKSFAKFAFLKGKIIVSYSYLPNNLWMKSFPFFSLSRNVPIHLTIKTTKTDLLDINNWIIQGGDIQ